MCIRDRYLKTNSRSILNSNKKDISKAKSKIEVSSQVGKVLAQRAMKNKINKVVFDRNGYPYHGRIKAVADAAREAGLEF